MIESSGKNYIARLSPHADVVIGDENSLTFKPHVRLRRWGEEAFVAFGLPTARNLVPSFDGKTLTWTDGINYEMRWYERPAGPGMELGGLEYEIVLLKKPASNVFAWPVSTQALEWFFQPPLTPFELLRGNVRPPNVIGSYAVYHANMQPLYRVGGDAAKYQTGKAFHFYRPEAIDAVGRRVWLDVTYDPAGQTLRFTLDAAWLATAVYPVVIDPTVGYTTLGGSTDGTNNYQLANDVTAGTTGDANPGTAFVGCSTSGGNTGVLSVYVDGSASPNGKARLAESAAITPTGVMGFRSAALTWTGITSGTHYWLNWCSGANHSTAYDAGLTCFYDAGPSFPNGTSVDPYGTNDGNFDARVSMYVDYTAAAGGAVTGFMTMNTGYWGS